MARRAFVTECIVYRTAGMMDVLEQAGETSQSIAPGFPRYVEEYALECSAVKVVASENQGVIADEGVQIHGGYGYSEEFALARAYRDARITRIFEGTNEINRLFIPAMLLRRAERGKIPLLAAIGRVQKELLSMTPTGAAPSSPIERAEEVVANLRRLFLLLAGVAYQRFGNNLLEEQEVLGGLADLAMELYKLDSVALRTRKTTARNGDQNRAKLQQDLLELQLADTLQAAQVVAQTLLPHIAAGDEMRSYTGLTRRLLKCEPVDLVAISRRVAKAVYDAQAYPL